MVFRQEAVGGRASVTTDEERAFLAVWREMRSRR